jgi:hypothetical protein
MERELARNMHGIFLSSAAALTPIRVFRDVLDAAWGFSKPSFQK